jgi:hypothetical protein
MPQANTVTFIEKKARIIRATMSETGNSVGKKFL